MFGWFKKEKKCELCKSPLGELSYVFSIHAFDGDVKWHICAGCCSLVEQMDKAIKTMKKKRIRGED